MADSRENNANIIENLRDELTALSENYDRMLGILQALPTIMEFATVITADRKATCRLIALILDASPRLELDAINDGTEAADRWQSGNS